MKKSIDLLNELGFQSKDNMGSLIIDTDKIKHIVNDNLNSDPYERKIYMKKKIFSGVLVAAVIFTITSLSVLAATFNWHEKLIEYFKPTKQQMEELEDSVNTPLVSAESNGYTVNVLQTITDKHATYILYEVTAPKNVVLSDDIQWKNDFLEYTSEAEDERGVYGGGGSKILEIKDNKMTVLRCEEQGGRIINNQNISLHLENLVTYTPDDYEEITVGKCSFDLNWKFSYKDMTKTFEINKKVNVAAGLDNTLKNIDVSPMSVWIFIDGNDATMAAMPVINFKDGNKINLSAENSFNYGYSFSANQDKDGGIITLSYKFDKITDIKDIESITVGDLTVPIK